MEVAIETQGLSKTYKGGVEALRGVSLTISRGSCFGLLGPNGAGKSTLVKTLLSIVHATAGRATILGRDFRDHESRRGVGYLPEGHRFPRYLTGEGVCRYFGRLSGLGKADLDWEIPEKLELTGMKEWARTSITKYSKGMMQRVGLAQAMLGNPAVIFLDEPTDGVDPLGRHELRAVIRQLAARGTTVLMNSHLLSEVEVVCDQIAIMHKGTIIEQGTVDAIKARFDAKGGKPEVTFSTGPLPDELWQRLVGWGARREAKGEGFHIALPGPEAITPLIDELRKAAVLIFGIEQVRSNLEDAFVALIMSQDDQGVGGTRQ